MGKLLKVFLPYSLLLIGIGLAIWVSNYRPSARAVINRAYNPLRPRLVTDDDENALDEKLHLDPVCHMEVTSVVGFRSGSIYGNSYHFLLQILS